MKKIDFLRLMGRISDGTATDEDVRLYNAYYHFFQQTAAVWDEQRLGNQDEIGSELADHIKAAIRKPHGIRRLSWPRITAAASLILGLTIGGYFLVVRKPERQTIQTANNDIVPGGNKAILTLANGEKIILTGARNGTLAKQGGATVNKTTDGGLVYYAPASESGATLYNTMTTPRGGQYHLTLADGTNVWLNAASSIKYPTDFNRVKERLVEITGEAYFEVAHNKAMPFRVSAAKQLVEVLGTHFDVNAYNDEPHVTTTLLEGSVKIASGNDNVIIKPGQQAILADDEFSIKNVDTQETIAWKDGIFRFTNESLESIMRKISRWYNINIEYADNDIKSLPFNGIINHFCPANDVLRMLERTQQVHFKIERNKIIVMK